MERNYAAERQPETVEQQAVVQTAYSAPQQDFAREEREPAGQMPQQVPEGSGEQGYKTGNEQDLVQQTAVRDGGEPIQTEGLEQTDASAQTETPADSGENPIASMLPVILSALGGGGELPQSGREKLNLLMAVKPFIQEEHRRSIDRAAGLVKVAQAAQAAFGGLGGLGESLFK